MALPAQHSASSDEQAAATLGNMIIFIQLRASLATIIVLYSVLKRAIVLGVAK